MDQKFLHPSMSITKLPNIGKQKKTIFQEMGIKTIWELLHYMPRSYLDRRRLSSLHGVHEKEWINTQAQVVGIHKKFYSNKKSTLVEIWDGTDKGQLIYYHQAQYLRDLFVPGNYYYISGTATRFNTGVFFIHPEVEPVTSNTETGNIHFKAIVPIYSLPESMRKSRLSSRFLRKTILYALNHISLIPDLLPKQLLSTKKLITYPAALNYIHFPPNYDKLREARKRIIFEEFFRYSLHLHKTKQHISSLKKERTYRFILSEHKALLRKIPYRLTKEQKKAALDIFRDLESPSPMRRLLQGEVGSGKTIVAVISMYLVYLRGYQVCLLAPTEILARQHMGFIQGLGIVPPKDLYLLVSATPPEEREKALMDLLNKDSCFVIGTHALFQEKVSFNNLAYVIIDEQHKFGIHQKAALLNKGRHIDMLLLSATPIPRSLASSLLGALNISTIKRTPFEGAPQQTLLLPRHRIQGVYNSVEKYVYQGKQIYWLFPFIHHNKEMPHVHSLQNGFPDLVERFAPRISVEQIHGQQPLAQKERTMNQFYHGQIDILATTSIIEVGIDNPNATVMIIENPERFGLAALHQIRGRVNRSQEPSFCVLLYNTNLPKETLQRLSIFQKNHSGYFLALQDLKKRGPGDLIDNKQHGMPRFLLADLNRDFSLFLAASESSLAWLHQQNDTGPNPHKIKKHILALQWLS